MAAGYWPKSLLVKFSIWRNCGEEDIFQAKCVVVYYFVRAEFKLKFMLRQTFAHETVVNYRKL
jgi:hypothetical protein